MGKYLVIGNPVEHSVSPIIQNTIFKYLGLPYDYGMERVYPRELKQFVMGFVPNGGCGFNVTVPHKRKVMDYVNGISLESRIIGAVNTVCVKSGMLFGYNTDAEGFIKQLQSDHIRVENSRVKIIGAGGAARAIAYALHKYKARTIKIYNRTFEPAKEICNMVGDRTCAYQLAEFTPDFCDILINTTSVGLFPNIECSPVENLDGLLPHTAVVDIIYNPPKTKFMQMAEARGNPTFNGLKMLIYQGMLANDLWFGGNTVDNKVLFDEILKNIKDKGILNNA